MVHDSSARHHPSRRAGTNQPHRRQGTKVLANRVLALVSKMFNFGFDDDWVTSNPCRLMKRPFREMSRDRVLTPSELKRVWKALEHEAPFFRAFFQLRIVTAQRGGEVCTMKWSHVDFDTGWWTIPAELSKNGVAHRVPLNQQAIQILETLKEWQQSRLREINQGRARKGWPLKDPSEWVFASSKGEGPIPVGAASNCAHRKSFRRQLPSARPATHRGEPDDINWHVTTGGEDDSEPCG